MGHSNYKQELARKIGLSWGLPVLILALTLIFVGPALAQEQTLAEQLRGLAHVAEEGLQAVEQNRLPTAQAEYDEVHRLWESFEEQVRQQDPTAYIELEGAMHGVRDSLQAEPLNPAAVRLAYDHLQAEANEIAERFEGGAAPLTETVKATPADLVKSLGAAQAAIGRGDVETAQAEVLTVIRAWPSVEGTIATRSPEAYNAIELDLSRAAAALEAQPANLVEAGTAVEQLEASLAPFVGHQTYTMFDAAAILLREGLEALLVIVALLAFLRRSGNQDKRSWIWLGGALGVLASIIIAVVLQRVFSLASSGQNRELIEGLTGLFAAGLLFYVSFWLHSKASLRGWQQYINARTSQALRRGSLAGLALLAFLAVFREGAETAVFYLGMAPSIALSDLLLGLGIGSAALVVAAVLILVAGVRLPLRFFFRVAGLLVFYLGFKFLGTGIHALQVAGVLPASIIGPVPAVPFVGVYPTWETMIPQLVLIVAALAAIWYLRQLDQRSQAGQSAAAT